MSNIYQIGIVESSAFYANMEVSKSYHSGKTNRMMQFGDNLRAARTKAKLTREALAEKLGVSSTTIYRKENGERKLELEELADYAEALNCSVFNLISGNGSSKVHVRAKIILGEIHMIEALQDKELLQVDLPPGIEYSNKLYIIMAEDDSMADAIYKGYLIIAEEKPDAVCENLNSKIPYVVKIANGKTLIRFIRKGYTFGKYNLVGHNADVTEDATLEYCHKIIGIFPR